MTWLLVAVGAGVGAGLRHLLAQRLPGRRATLGVNVVGSLLLGLLAGAPDRPAVLLGVGLCGGLTTFSTYAVEAVRSRSRGYVAVTTVACLGAAGLGLAVAHVVGR